MKDMLARLIRKGLTIRRNLSTKFLFQVALGHGGGDRSHLVDTPLSDIQKMFILWNAERLGITEQESRRRYYYSWNVVSGGHRSLRFMFFMYLNQEIFSVFHGNRVEELFDTYTFHGYRDLLMMLANKPHSWTGDHPLIKGLEGREQISILDYGCGLAHNSRAICDVLLDRGQDVHLYLSDIPTVIEEFLEWVVARKGIPSTFLICTKENPIPEIPECDVCISTEFFEHVDDPVKYFDLIDEKLRPGGYMVTNVGDHNKGFLHLSPDLSELRRVIRDRGYTELQRNLLFRKGEQA